MSNVVLVSQLELGKPQHSFKHLLPDNLIPGSIFRIARERRR